MVTIAQIYEKLAEIAPPALAASWDNVGLLVDAGIAPTAILFALDITPEVVEEAAALNCHLIVSHHPVIFHPMKTITTMDVPFQLVSKRISAICMHTNLDITEGGVNDILASRLGLQNTEVFAEGYGRVGVIPPTTPLDFSEVCARALGARVKCISAGEVVTRVGVVGGAGGSFVQEAHEKGVDLLVTGEAGHHDALDAKRLGVSLMIAGHYATEFPVVPVLADKIKQAFPSLKCYVSGKETEPFDYL